MRRTLLITIGFLLSSAGIIFLFYSAYLLLYPQYSITITPIPQKISGWDNEIICARAKPTPLFLNVYGNSKEPWIALLFGREKEVALTFIFRTNSESQNVVRYAVINNENKELSLLNEEEAANYLKNFIFTKEEEIFLHLCVYNALMPKTAL